MNKLFYMYMNVQGMRRNVFTCLITIFLLASCQSYKKVPYLQDVEVVEQTAQQENLYDETHFMFLTDHGGIEYGHGGVSTDEMVVPWGITGPHIAKGMKMKEANNTVNTASVILHLFEVEQPLCWTGEVPTSIFK